MSAAETPADRVTRMLARAEKLRFACDALKQAAETLKSMIDPQRAVAIAMATGLRVPLSAVASTVGATPEELLLDRPLVLALAFAEKALQDLREIVPLEPSRQGRDG